MTQSLAFHHALAAALPPDRAVAFGDLDGAAVQRLWESARKRWPEVEVDPARFADHVVARLDPDAPLLRTLGSLHIDELYLACACTQGLPQALAIFERDYLDRIDAALRRVRGIGDHVDEVKQQLRTELFTPVPGKIASYSGRGSLLGWLRITAVRAAHRLVGQHAREVPVEDHLLADAAPQQDDHELEYFKRLYRREFKEAFGEAVRDLERRERNLLRHHVVDALSIDQIAAIYHVHRSTAARQLDRARSQLRDRTRDRLVARLSVGPDQLRSIVRMIDSELDVSMHRVLREQAAKR